MAYIPDSGSVVAFQSDPSKLQASVRGNVGITGSVFTISSIAGVVQTNNASVITVNQGSIAAVIIGGSIAASFTPPANQSVSGTIQAQLLSTNASVITVGTAAPNQSVSGTVQGELLSTNASVITVNKSSIAVVIIGGSIAASFTPPANQSVSGRVETVQTGTVIASLVSTIPSSVIVGASIFGLAPVNIIQGNASVTGTMSILGTVPVTQATTPWLVGSIYGNIGGSVAAFIVGNASIITVAQSSVAVAIVSGSIAATFTPPANQSVSGAVSVSNFPTNQNVSGSVVAFQGTTPWVVAPNNSSIVTIAQGSVATVIIGGSIAASFTPPANQSVSGTVQAQLQSTNASVITVGGAAGTQYAENAITPSVTGTAIMFRSNHSSSIMSVVDPVTPLPIVGSVQGTFSVIGVVPVAQSGAWTVSVVGTVGASIIGQLPTGTAIIGSIAVLQGTTPWLISSVYGNIGGSVVAFQGGAWTHSVVGSVSIVGGTVGASVVGIAPVTLTANTIPATSSILVGVTANTNGSVLTTTGYTQAVVQITSGPGASLTGALNFEGTLDGTAFVPIQGYNLATNAISSMATVESDWAFNTAGLQGIRARVSNWTVGSITARAVVSPSDARPYAQLIVGTPSISGTVLIGNTNLNVSGSVVAFQGGIQVTSLVSTVPSSVIVGASIFGQLPAGTAVLGSIVAYQGAATPWVIGSVYGNISGSVVAFQGTAPWVIQSIVGTYAEDSASADGDKGLLAFGIRNDSLSSITGSNLDYGAWAQDSSGRHLIKPFVSEDGTIISYVGSVVSGSVTLIQASAVGKRNYITDFWLVNTGAATTLVTFQDGSTSIVGYGIAPTAGGMSSPGLSIPLKTAPSQDLAFKMATGTSVLYVTVKGYQAP